MSDAVRDELIRRANETGKRAIEWDLSTFDKVGGSGTIRSVWNTLKSKGKVDGKKRSAPGSDSILSDEGDNNKKKVSLNISETCDMISEILLEGSGEEDYDLSKTEDDRWEASLSEYDVTPIGMEEGLVVASNVVDEVLCKNEGQ